MALAAVERRLLDAAVRHQQDRPARRLVYAARLHADEPVFQKVQPPDAVFFSVSVQRRQQRRRAHRLAIDGDSVAALEANLDDLRLVGRVFRRNRPHMHKFRRRLARVLKHFAL